MGSPTYLWRKLTAAQREELKAWRRSRGQPWHRPPHYAGEKTHYHVTAACFEHRHYIGDSHERIDSFCATLAETVEERGARVQAWCVLPNHYHLLIESTAILEVLKGFGQMHGRLSYLWNGADRKRGRQVWCGAVERAIRSDAHYWATVNYIHHNPVRHGYVERWQDWPFSSATDYLAEMGPEEAARVWKEYPLLEYGKGWDDPAL